MPDEKDDDEGDGSLTEQEIVHYIKNCWKKEFRAFYNPQDFLPAISEGEGKRYEKDIVTEVRSGLATARTSKNLDLKWKPLVNLLNNG